MHYKEKQRQIHITTYLHAQQNYEVMRKYKKVGDEQGLLLSSTKIRSIPQG